LLQLLFIIYISTTDVIPDLTWYMFVIKLISNDDDNDDKDDDLMMMIMMMMTMTIAMTMMMMVYIIISYTSISRKKMSYKIKYIIRKALKAEKKRERVREVELLISSRPWNKSTFYYWRLATKTAGLDRPTTYTTAAASTRTTLHPRDHSRPAIQSSVYGKLYFVNSFIVRMYRYAPNTQHNNNRD